MVIASAMAQRSRPWRGRSSLILLGCILFLLLTLTVASVGYSGSYDGRERSTQETYDNAPRSGKTIWIEGVAGSEDADAAAASWTDMNPGWNVVRMPSSSRPSLQAGLEVLVEHGGVWVHPTVTCMRPLDEWVYDAVEPEGFWMFRQAGHPSASAAPWLVVTIKQRSGPIARWLKRGGGEDAFSALVAEDAEFARAWSRVPKIEWGSGIADSIVGKRPISGEDLPLTAAPAPAPALATADSDSAMFTSPLVVVVADCRHEGDVVTIRNECTAKGAQLIVYDKCNFCQHVPPDVYARPLINRGREGHTFLHFVIRHYHRLPEMMVFLPGNLQKHDRLARFLAIMDDPDSSGCPGSVLRGMYEFVLDDYEGAPMYPASVRPFGKWFERFVGPWSEEGAGPCWNGIMRTTRAKVLSHPLEFYRAIYDDLMLSPETSTEAAHFLERSMMPVFAS